jgi:raffinose/stachyose/melibiose transport system substrate-binding protein
MTGKRSKRYGAFVALAMVVAACSSSSAPSTNPASSPSAPSTNPAESAAPTSTEKVTLTLWQNLGQGNQADVVPKLIAAFEKTHPNITINNVQQPRAQYFALLSAAAISQSGPDLVNMWTGLFTMQYRSYLENLKGLVPSADLANVTGTEWSSVGFNSPDSPYVMPLQVQFYIGFYNKKLFSNAGISAPPTTWSELRSDCQKIIATGVTCIQMGTQNLTGEFSPWYDLSYMMAGAFSLDQWQSLYNGQIQWTDPAVQAQLENWHQLYVDGYMNKDALTATNAMSPFINGQAAMIIKINNDAGPFYDALKGDVGVFVPPFSDTPTKKVVEFAGNGFAITSYSPNKAAAAEFLRFMTTAEAGQIVAETDLIPAVKGIDATNPLAKEMLSLVSDQGFTVYPMLDNVLATPFVDAATTVVPSLLVGNVSVQDATSSLAQSWQQLPASERTSTWADYQVP